VRRALRRLVARDPEAPIHVELDRARDSILGVLHVATRPAVKSVGELLGAEAATATPAATETKSSEAGPAVAVAVAAAGAAARAGRFSALDPILARLGRYRRQASVGACVLLVAVAAVGTMPAVSAAGVPDATAAPSDAAITISTVVDPAANSSPASPVVDGDPGDGSVYNVMQAVDAAPGSTGFQIYVVRGGDNLGKIAARFGLVRNTVYWANTSRLPDPASLKVGQKLVIPPADGITVTVKASNTLSGLASKYKVSTAAVMRANTMTSASLTVGQLLLIPTKAVPAIPTPKPAAGGGGGTVWRGQRLRWPVPASHDITQYYSARSHPAIDIGAPTGTTVIAAVSGTVTWAGWKTSGGGYGGGIEIWINSGGKLWTTYNHLSRVYVHVGQVVPAGLHIGNVGMTGNATGPHLHFEVWVCPPWSDGTTSCTRNPFNYF
jgi:murein DD-endopeptidase MepM/ murein hydrolase activator NlpD